MSIRYLISRSKVHSAKAASRGLQRPPRLDETPSNSIDTCAKNHNKSGSESALQTLKKLPEHLA